MRWIDSLDPILDLDGATKCVSQNNINGIEPVGLNIGGESTGIPVKLLAAPKNFRGHADLSNLNKALIPTAPLNSDV